MLSMKLTALSARRRAASLTAALSSIIMMGCASEIANPGGASWLDGMQLGPTANERFFIHHQFSPDNGLLFDAGARSDKLRMRRATGKRKSILAGERTCPPAPDAETLDSLAMASLAGWRTDPSGTLDGRNFSRVLNASAMRLMLDHDEQRAARDVALLASHASSAAWIHPTPKWSAYNSVSGALPTLVPAWRILRQTEAADPVAREKIDGWLRDLALFANLHPKIDGGTATRAASLMQIGVMLGDTALFESGAAAYTAMLDTLDEDGAFATEMRRGANALSAHARVTGAMVLAAEVAMDAGRDFYSMTNARGDTLLAAIEFLITADKDASIMAKHTSEPQSDAFAGSNKAWIELYSRRFPEATASYMLNERATLGNRIFGETAAGWVSCYSSALDR